MRSRPVAVHIVVIKERLYELLEAALRRHTGDVSIFGAIVGEESFTVEHTRLVEPRHAAGLHNWFSRQIHVTVNQSCSALQHDASATPTTLSLYSS